MKRLLIFAVIGCGSPRAPAPPASGVSGRTAEGAMVRLAIEGEKIASVAPATSNEGWLWVPVIDSHVHLAYWAVADRLAAAGVEGVVDLAAPERTLGQASPIDVLAAGPMLTHPNGYPLDTWGSDGYGIGCGDLACVTAAIDRLAGRGVKVIKIALDDDGLDRALVPAAVTAAHAHGLKVAVHALSDASAAFAAGAGVDLLAHTPTEPLAVATVEAWRGRAVISTLAAFGGSAEAIDNLVRLRAAGATVLYGTDLGNSREAGPSAAEIRLLGEAGLDDAAITAAMTTVPAAYWGFPFAISAGREATFLVLDRDPRRDVQALVEPRAVWSHGRSLVSR